MADLNLGRMISKFINYQTLNIQKQPAANQAVQNSTYTPAPQTQPSAQFSAPQQALMGGTDQSVYVKDLMKLPKNLNELVFMLQKNMTYSQFNQCFAQSNLRSMSQTQAQILAQLQDFALTENMVLKGDKTLLTQMQSNIKNLLISSNSMINLADISAMIQANGKDAIAKLITTMASTAKLGVQDLSQLKETAKLINASVAAASQNDNAQTMKLLMLLYLPWLPLQEGVGFDLEIETRSGSPESDSILIINITTLNFGNVKAVLFLENSNSVRVNVECVKEFPKDELLLRIGAEEKHYSMQSSVTFETSSQNRLSENREKPQAKINMSNTNEINPYLLLMAHTIIRHVIEIDKMNVLS